MASSSNPNGKQVLLDPTWHVEEEILCITPNSSFNPYVGQAQGEGNQALIKPKASAKIREGKGHFTVTKEDAELVQECDKVFRDSPEFEKYKNIWVPMSTRLTQWTFEIRCQPG